MVNIGILTSTSQHVQCLNSQQLFSYIIYLNNKSTTTNLGHGLCLGILEFLFIHDDKLILFS